MILILCIESLLIYWTGCIDEQGITDPIKIGNYRYDWYVIRNGVRTDSSKIFTVYENDTTHVELFY